MRKKKPWIITGLCLVLFALLWLGMRGCGRSAPKPSLANNTTVFTVFEYLSGTPIAKTQLASDASIFADLTVYVNDPRTAKGSISLTTYAPTLLVETDTIQINIKSSQVIVSTREKAGDVWYQVVRSKSSDDSKIESKVREFLRSSQPKNSGS